MKDYDPEPFAALLRRLLAERGESHREASLKAGLDHGAVFRFAGSRRRPARESIFTLAEYFRVNPNMLLEVAGYEPMEIFEKAALELPEAGGIVQRLKAIKDPVQRSRVIRALELLLDGWVPE